jgi:Ser-tRNA(Ala) deacylase AlaX
MARHARRVVSAREAGTMTRKVFWDDPYRTTLDTRVAGVNGNDITLAETIFYALSGGQESDHGTIGGRPVLAARKDGAGIVYTLEAGHGLNPGDAVTIVIDWARRYRLMRLHLAAEIVLELAYQNLAGIEKIGAHIAADKARIDFAWDENIAKAFALIGEKARALIAADHPIVSAYSDEAQGRRYWEIAGFARVPCGGTHLRRTGEIGAIALKRVNIGKGKERIEIQVGDAPCHAGS